MRPYKAVFPSPGAALFCSSSVVPVWSRAPQVPLQAAWLRERRFPARNRIIAGLSLATVVVEARERSGALITADFALELGRDVFAVPGEITSGLSAGTNDLLRQGAAPMTSLRDVLESLGVEPEPAARAATVSDAALAVLSLLGDGASGADELTRSSGLSSAEVAAALVELELGGLAAQADGVYRSFSPGRSRGARRPA
jgi:DNA processing protein